MASAFASNHLCARIAFDHGASVATGVSVRATFTALFLFFMMRLQGVRIAIPRELRGATLLAGMLIATQSYTLYSAVAIIPPALALLVFQTSPMLYVLLTWALGKERPLERAAADDSRAGRPGARLECPYRREHGRGRRLGVRQRAQHDGRLLPERECAQGARRAPAHSP